MQKKKISVIAFHPKKKKEKKRKCNIFTRTEVEIKI